LGLFSLCRRGSLRLVNVAGEFRCGGNPFTISRLVRTSMAAFRCTVIIQQILQKVSSGHPSCLPPVSVSFLSARPRHFPSSTRRIAAGVRKMHNAARLAGLLPTLENILRPSRQGRRERSKRSITRPPAPSNHFLL